MRVVALISGGKDSCYNMLQCEQQGHVIVALANLKPQEGDELDSYMYQTVGHHGVNMYAEAMGLPLYQRIIQGSPVEQGRVYTAHKQDEVEDLYELLKEIKMDVSFDAVSVGAILSDYQRVRVEHVCSRLGLSSLAYLWRRDQKALLEEMVSSGIHAILIKVAAMGLSPSKHLGLSISEVYPLMCSLNDKYGLNICGEGGEYETFTLDCPLFKKKIIIDESEVVIHSDDAFAPVGFLHFKKMHLQDREQTNSKYLVDTSGKSCEWFKKQPDCLTRVDRKKAEKEFEKVFVPLRCNENREDHIKYSKCGNYLWVSGIHGPSVVAGKTLSIEDATKNAMQRLSEMLSSLDSCLMDAVMVHLFVKNMDDFAKVNSVYKTFFAVNPPARACIQLNLPANILFQLDCLVYSLRTEEEDVVPPPREAMHVQSISYWAPANIGPYSQAIKVGNTMFVSGSIGLWPATMTLVKGGILEEAPLSLQHVDRIISAFAPGKSIQSVIHSFCFVTSSAHVAVAKTAWCEAFKAKSHSSEQDKSLPGVVSFAVVPALPKGASIEWHVVAQDTLLNHQRNSKSLSAEEFSVDVQSMAVTGRMSKTVALNCVIESTSARCDLEKIMDCFADELKNCASGHNLSLSNLMYTRIFYVKSIMEHWNALHLIQDCLQRSCIPTPAFSLVPVDALERDQVKMVFACLLQRPDVDTLA